MNTVLKPLADRGHITDTTTVSIEASNKDVAQRINAVDWQDVEEDLNQHGSAMLRGLLSVKECDTLAALYARDELYRSTVLGAVNTNTSTIRCQI
jgi:hypothetical protein